MGGYFSTRWGWERTRQDTDPLMKLDVRWLQRVGALAPNTAAYPSWARRGDPSGNIVTRTNGDASVLTLSYTTTNIRTGESEHIRDDVELERLENTLGGHRTWFRCPDCTGRCAVLFCGDGRFRCRHCHHLAYTSTREDRLDRARRRCEVLQKRLGLASSCGVNWDYLPPKPKGMHWDTYERLFLALTRAQDAVNDAFVADLDKLLARTNALIARHKASK